MLQLLKVMHQQAKGTAKNEDAPEQRRPKLGLAINMRAGECLGPENPKEKGMRKHSSSKQPTGWGVVRSILGEQRGRERSVLVIVGICCVKQARFCRGYEGWWWARAIQQGARGTHGQTTWRQYQGRPERCRLGAQRRSQRHRRRGAACHQPLCISS